MSEAEIEVTGADYEASENCEIIECHSCEGTGHDLWRMRTDENGILETCTFCHGRREIANPAAFARHRIASTETMENMQALIVKWLRRFASESPSPHTAEDYAKWIERGDHLR